VHQADAEATALPAASELQHLEQRAKLHWHDGLCAGHGLLGWRMHPVTNTAGGSRGLTSLPFARLRRSVYRAASSVDQLLGCSNSTPFILCYHSVAENGWRFAVALADIRRQLTYLAEHYHALTASDLECFVLGRKPVPAPSFVVTFDDGYRDVLEVQSTLERLAIRPLLFMVSDAASAIGRTLPDGCELLRHDELRALSGAGWEIGSHSATHADLPGLGDDELTREFRGSKLELETTLGKPIRYFAYPKGRYTQRVAEACRSAGYAAAFSMDDGFISPATDRYAIPRIGVDGTHSFEEFKTLASPSVVRLRGLIKRSSLGAFL
jgi:peptidoglycan/xylan/chitin deacetylase (PgdA/CDA1 family)